MEFWGGAGPLLLPNSQIILVVKMAASTQSV
jgi:hypothetical protein